MKGFGAGGPGGKHVFGFDKVFMEGAAQDEVFEEIS